MEGDRPLVLVNPPGTRLGERNAIVAGAQPRFHVADFPGPLSIKSVAAGWGVWSTAAGTYRVDPGSYLVLNAGRVYSLEIRFDRPVCTFCPFFESGFVEAAYRALVAPDRALLDDPFEGRAPAPHFVEQLYAADDLVSPLLGTMHAALGDGSATDDWLDAGFHELAARLIRAQVAARCEIDRVPAARPSTRTELYRRLHRARDFLHGHFAEPVTLGRLARVACLSPHHFHRAFRELFGQTPHRYLTALRLERARSLLEQTDAAVTEVCLAVGFESLGSFSTRFRRESGRSPAAYRAARRNSQDPRSNPAGRALHGRA